MIGPFTQTPVLLASAPTSYALVNTGTAATDLSATAYNSDGTAVPAVSVLNAGQQLVSTGPAWVQAWANPSTVAGVSWLDNGAQFAVTPAVNPDEVFVLTDVEYSAATSTEIDFTNTSLFDSSVTVNLFGAVGASKGSFTIPVSAKNSISERVEGMFPNLATGFTGYLTAVSNQPLTVSGIRWSGDTATGLVAQAVNSSSFAITQRFYPQLASGVATTLHLVNANASTANVTLKAWSAAGSAAAPSVKVPLAPGQQYTASIASIFGRDPVGSIEVDSDTPGIYGDVLTMDSSLFPNFAVSLPLSQPLASSVLPYATNATTVYAFNPNSSPATVTVTPFSANGVKGSASSTSVPANGRAAISVSANAYVTISSTQPVVAGGWMTVASGTTTGYLALPAVTASNTGGIGPINGGGTTVEFGSVAVGSTATGTLTIYNTGSAALTVSAISISDPQFTIVTPKPPFTMAAGASQAISLQFKPTSTGEQVASLTITAGGSTTLFAPVTLLGLGTGQVSAPVVQFGSVQVGSTATAAVTVNNTGTVSLTVTAITSSDPEYTVTTALPITIAAGAQMNITVQFLPTSAGEHAATLTFTANGSTTTIAPVNLDGTGVAGSSPQITAGGVVNAADYAAKVSRGALAFAFGTNLATAPAQASSLPLQLTLGGVSVTVGGIPAPVFIVNAAFVEFQIPYAVPLGASIPVLVTVNGVQSNAVTVAVADYALGVFTYNRTATIIDPDVFHLNGTLLTPSNPAIPSETLIVIANGIGKLNNPPATGAAVGPPYPTAVDAPVVTVAGLPANSQYAGLLAADLGVVQMNIQLPANLPSGSLPLVIQFPGDSSPPVNLYVAGNVTATPKIGVTPASLNFGNVSVGATSSLSLAISNNGTAALTVNSIASSSAAFAAASPAMPFTVQPGALINATIRFAPTTAGAQSGTLTIASNDPASSQITVGVAGVGTSAAAPSINTSLSTIAFGSVTVGASQSQTLTINNIGTATLSVGSISSNNSLFTANANSVSVAAGASFNLSVQFAPTAAGGQTGTLTLSTNDPAHPSVTVALSGTGVAASPATATLSVDGGVFTNAVGFPGSPLAVFVNRLTPPSYPATLTAVEIYFGNRAAGLPVNTTIELVAATNPSGSANFTTASVGVLNLYNAGIAAVGAFNVYTLPTTITITSGDFVVGFSTPDATGIYPADQDQATKSQGRSYVSTDGTSFTVVDSYGASVSGNFGIRAVVTLGGSQ